MRTKLLIPALMLTASLQAQNSIIPIYTGQVVDANNQPVIGAIVNILNDCDNQNHVTYTNYNGWYFYQGNPLIITQPCDVYLHVLSNDSSVYCSDTISLILHPSMTDTVYFTSNFQLTCDSSNYSSGNCNVSWGFYQDSINSCVYHFWHQGVPGTAFWEVYGPDYHYSSHDSPYFTFSESGAYSVLLYLNNNNCIYYDTLYIDTICDENDNSCNIPWGFVQDTSNACTYQFWHTANYALWTFGNGDMLFNNGQNSFFYTWYWGGTYTVCVLFPNCAPQCTTITIPNSCGPIIDSSNCNAYFYWWIDSLTNETHIYNPSAGNDLIYYWDLGDGNGVYGNTPSHTYTTGGWYYICLTVTSVFDSTCYDLYCDTVYVPSGQLRIMGPTGLNSEQSEIGISLYPNPVMDQLNIQFSETENMEATIEIYSISGSKMIQLVPQVINSGSIIRLSVESLSSGMYMVRITDVSSGRSWVKKFMK